MILVHRFLNSRIQSACYLFLCKAEEGGDAAASLTDDFMPVGYNEADGKIDNAESAVTGRMEY